MHLPQLRLGEPAEGFPDVRGMAGEDLGEELPSRVGQVQPVGPAVLGVGTSLDPPGRADAIDQADDVPLRDQEPLGQLLLGDALAVQQRRQDVELGQRQSMGRQGLPQPALQAVIDAGERHPDLDLPASGVFIQDRQ